MKDLKNKTIRGGLAKVGAQSAAFALRLGSLMVLSRLLEPNDFGLVGMVAALLGIFNLLKDFGLTTATVQRLDITEDELSTLFWVNMAGGCVLALLALGAAPLIAQFYRDSRLVAVTTVMATGFIFNGAGVQHSALLQRQMRFALASALEIVALLASTSIGLAMAFNGFGYWALVVMGVSNPLVLTIGLWIATRWLPGRPRRGADVLPMMRFGGLITVNCMVLYLAQNMDKVLLGRFWGPAALGIYGRAYQLISIPTENLNYSVGGVAVSALARLQEEPERLKSYFLKGYSLMLGLAIPITLACALLAQDLVGVLLGPKWTEAVPIFQLLAPTILVLGLINPLSWMLFSTGLAKRSLKIALVLAPIVILGYLAGLPYGPKGVALGYSTMLALWVLPHIAWCVHGTAISFRDICMTIGRPLIAGGVAAALTFAGQLFYGPFLAPLPRLMAGGAILAGVYLAILLYVMGQKDFYLGLLLSLRAPPGQQKTVTVPA